MLDKLRAAALSELGSEEAADAFVDGFQKQAAFGAFNFNGTGPGLFQRVMSAIPQNTVAPAVVKSGIGLGAALLGAAIIKGVTAGSNAISSYNTRGKFEAALAQVMANNKIVKGAPPNKAKDYAETIYRFAPHVAADPNLLSSILANAVLGEGIDPQTIKTLVELEGRFADNSSAVPIPGIRPVI